MHKRPLLSFIGNIRGKMAAPMETNVGEEFPSELRERLGQFDGSLTEIERIFNPLLSKPLSDVHEGMSALDKAKLDLTGVYAINSLFWMYLNTKGESPKDHPVKQELDRIRSNMGRLKEIQDKQKAPKINKNASKRFVRSALWQAAHAQAEGAAAGGKEQTQSPQEPPTKVRREEKTKKKKKKKNK